ncbi:chromosome transmission fidelity protein 8 homolog [Leptinotarsa decemlineata]|uniref:chromosome transmission fidelity protein 8 homolog n=1 Tax=Leptinotarsa decemlineata TaxID=7539 RepID=UPI003D30D44A
MAIIIRVPSEGASEEWAIIELQGDIKSHTDSNFEGKYIGDLHFTKSGTPLLIIGHHLMYGKEAKLEKPFALLQKKRKEDNTEYLVKSIIRNKIIFKTRPKPIVGKHN